SGMRVARWAKLGASSKALISLESGMAMTSVLVWKCRTNLSSRTVPASELGWRAESEAPQGYPAYTQQILGCPGITLQAVHDLVRSGCPQSSGVVCGALTLNGDKIARNLGASDVESFQRRFVTLGTVQSRRESRPRELASANTADLDLTTGDWQLTTSLNSLRFRNFHVTPWGSRFCRKFPGKAMKTKNRG